MLTEDGDSIFKLLRRVSHPEIKFGMNLVRVVQDNVQLMLWEYHNVLKYSSLLIHVGQGAQSQWCERRKIE